MNFSKGKTECILRHFGDDSQDLMACLQRVDDQTVITGDDVVVRVVRSYRHLCTIHTATGNMTEEARARVRVMMAAYRELAGRVFGPPKIVTLDHVAAGGHAVVVHPSLCHGDQEHVHVDGVEVLQHGLYACVAEMCGTMSWSRGPHHRRRTPHGVASAWDADTASS